MLTPSITFLAAARYSQQWLKRSEIDMQRLVFEPKSGSWILETLENNETVIMDFSELTPEGVGMRFDLDEVKRAMAGALADLERVSA